jgi:hypothetical protein
MYEKAKGSNAESGNPLWAYIHIYFADLNTAHDNYVEMISTLVTDMLSHSWMILLDTFTDFSDDI